MGNSKTIQQWFWQCHENRLNYAILMIPKSPKDKCQWKPCKQPWLKATKKAICQNLTGFWEKNMLPHIPFQINLHIVIWDSQFVESFWEGVWRILFLFTTFLQRQGRFCRNLGKIENIDSFVKKISFLKFQKMFCFELIRIWN